MGYAPSPENKINIHVGGVYCGKQASLARFAANYDALSDGCRARLTGKLSRAGGCCSAPPRLGGGGLSAPGCGRSFGCGTQVSAEQAL